MKLDVIIVHFGEIKKTKDCLASLEKQSNHFRDLIMINNGSSIDWTKETKIKKVSVTNLRQNNGFSKAVNLGIKQSVKNSSDAVLLLNNDSSLQEEMLTNLTTAIKKDPEIGIAAPLIEFKNRKKTYYDHGGYIQKLNGKMKHLDLTKADQQEIIDADYVSVCLLIKKEVFKKIGYLDQRFFLYYEDADFCMRAKKKGFRSVVVTNSRVLHESRSKELSKTTMYHLLRSGKRFYLKYFKMYPLGLLNVAKNTLAFSKKSPHNIPILLKALVSS